MSYMAKNHNQGYVYPKGYLWLYAVVCGNVVKLQQTEKKISDLFFSGLGSKITHKEDTNFSVMADLYCTHCQLSHT